MELGDPRDKGFAWQDWRRSSYRFIDPKRLLKLPRRSSPYYAVKNSSPGRPFQWFLNRCPACYPRRLPACRVQAVPPSHVGLARLLDQRLCLLLLLHSFLDASKRERNEAQGLRLGIPNGHLRTRPRNTGGLAITDSLVPSLNFTNSESH